MTPAKQNGKQKGATARRRLGIWGWVIAIGLAMFAISMVMQPRASRRSPLLAAVAQAAQTPPSANAAKAPTQAAKPTPLAQPPATQPAAQAAAQPAGQPTAQAAAVKPAAQAAAKPGDDKIQLVNFHFLSDYQYTPPSADVEMSADPIPGAPPAVPATIAKPKNVIPDKIRALNGHRVSIQGFMVPTDVNSGNTKEFLLVAVIPGCWYCQPPALNEYIIVKTKDPKGTAYRGGVPVIVTGRLEVGEQREFDAVTSLYRMTADDVAEGLAMEPLKQSSGIQ